MKKCTTVFFLLCLSLSINLTNAQEKKQTKPLKFKPLKFNITKDGSQWVRFILWNQLQLNSNNLEGKQDFKVTPMIRRSRLLVMSQIAPKLFTYIHVGVNKVQTSRLGKIDGSNESQLFLHGAAVDYTFSKELTIGAGLHYWRGLARLTSWASLSSLTYDIPTPLVFHGTVGAGDQFARHIGMYAKGSLGKFDYRLAINEANRNGFREPVTNTTTENAVYGAWNYHDGGRTVYEGSLKYNFIGKEGTLLPFSTGTYLGKKKTLSASVGFMAHPNSMLVLKNKSDKILEGDKPAQIVSKTKTVGSTHFSLDVNYDTPIGTDGGALSAYAAFLNYNFGENGASSAAATGNAFYTQIGYLIPTTKLQPYFVYQNRDWDATVLGSQRGGNSFSVGANYYVSGHNLRLTLDYSKNNYKVGESTSKLGFQVNVFL